jgi:hypothetical protein
LGTPPPIEAPLWTPSSKIEINMLSYGPPFSVSIDESWTLGKPYGIKLRYYSESLGEQLWNLGNPIGTHLGTREKNKNNLPLPSAKQKKTESIECLLIDCMKLLFSKSFLSSFLV